MSHASIMVSRTLLAALLLISPTMAAEPNHLRGAWLGVQAEYPMQRALLVEYMTVESGNQVSGDARFGSTGFRDKRLMTSVFTLKGSTDPRVPFVFSGPGMEMRLTLENDRLRGVLRYTRTGVERAMNFERTTEAAVAKAHFNPIPIPRAAELLVLYLGTPDCPWCRAWEANNRGKFLSSPLAKTITLVEVKGASLTTGVQLHDFPEQYRDIAKRIGSGRLGVPQFVVISNRRILMREIGTWAWEDRLEPLLHELVRWRASAER
jgi:hypothetical protein